ncbi:MAG: tetratricopeptide repeat protein [Chloroflexi bacterium]|nr:tetratricopeptide repeat protein [Chloroflexota bacterium]
MTSSSERRRKFCCKRLRLRHLSLSLCWLLLFMLLAGCATPDPTNSPLRLPTRIHRTPTPTPTLTLAPFPFALQDYYREGKAHQKTGDAEGAIQSFTWAILRAPKFVPAYIARGTAYLAQGELYPALADSDTVLEIDPANVRAYVLRGEVLRRMGLARLALQAFEQAIELDPDLESETFRSRWLLAREAEQPLRLLTLSREYTDVHPEDPLRYYYRGWAFAESDKGHIALTTLVDGIETASDPPALLWFALGQAYAMENAWQDAVIAFESARMLVQTGDISLMLHSDQPIVMLFDALGRAYMGAGRCVDAEIMLTYAIDIGAPASEYDMILEQIRTCQTPTPEATPYLTTTPG